MSKDEIEFMDYLVRYFVLTNKAQHWILCKELYEHYRQYCVDINCEFASPNRVCWFLEEMGVLTYNGDCRVYVGLQRLA